MIKRNMIFFIALLLSILFYILFIFYTDKYITSIEQQEVNEHAKIISESLWSFTPELAKDYLQLASKSHKYKKLVVIYSSNEKFINIEYKLKSPIDLFFESLSLISVTPLKSKIIHDTKVIGEISVEWYNTAIYIYLLVFIIIFLLLTIFWFILGVQKHRNKLEIRVKERTVELNKEIEDRKQAEALLKMSEYKFRALFNNTFEFIGILTPDGVLNEANQTALEFAGLKESDVIGKLFWETPWWSHSVELQEWLQDAISRAADGEFIRNEVWHQGPKGDIYIDFSLKPIINDEGKVIYIIPEGRDITERKLSEEQVHNEKEFINTAIDSLPGIFYLFTKDGKFLRWNHNFETVSGYSADEIGTMHPRDFFPVKEQALVEERISEVFAKGESFVEANWLSKDGTKTLLYLTGVRLSLECTLCQVGMGIDISERYQAEQTLRRIQKMDAISHLTSGIVHDFNNILGIILGNIDLLERLLLDDKEPLKRVATIKKSAQRAADLTRQLLGISHSQSTNTAVTNIPRIILDMDSILKHSVTPQIEVEQNFDNDLWLTKINQGDFQDALLNLIINANDSMPGGGRLTLEAHNCTLDNSFCTQNPGSIPGEYVQLVVSDTGDGISTEMQERIFEPFFTTKPQSKGIGLGLAMVYSFIKRSKGYIKVYSEQDVGTTFQLYLPRTDGQEQLLESNTEQHGKLQCSTETILVVDDEEELLEVTQSSLQALGYWVLTATNGQQALKKLAEEPTIKLLFSDVMMPGGMNGYELAEQATMHSPGLKVLLTSGFNDNTVSNSKQALFQANLLSKPYTHDELAQRVQALLKDNEQIENESSDLSMGEKQLHEHHTVTPIKWVKDFSIGIDAIDYDHKNLLKQLNHIRLAASNNKVMESLTNLEQLKGYAQTHFAREEAIMVACGYPGLDNHRQVHQLLFKEIDRMQKQHEQNKLSINELASLVNNWLVDHILGMDQAFASYCQDKKELIEQALEEVGPAQIAKIPVTKQTPIYLIDDEPQMVELLSDAAEMIGLSAQGFTSASHFFEHISEFEPGSILILDLQMPDMDGIEVMRQLALMADPPALILISGQDIGVLNSAEKLGRAHNLNIFASLTKPVRLGEFQQLLKTFGGSVHVKQQKNVQSTKHDITYDDLHQAISNDYLTLHYQPQVDISTGKVIGVEALVRLQHPERGLIYPNHFIPIAQQYDLMEKLSHWVIKNAVLQEQQWLDAELSIPVSINISATDITSLALPEQLADLLDNNKLDPTRLTLEVTESVLMGEQITSLDILTRLRLKGIQLSIDDFGTGFSSLSQLHQLPFSELKIDQSFVSKMLKDSEALAIVKTCILLGHELNMQVVAEGVEDQKTWNLLAENGCDLAQGYFIAKPMPNNDLIEWLRNRETPK